MLKIWEIVNIQYYHGEIHSHIFPAPLTDTGWHVLTVLLDIQKYRFPTEGEDTKAAGDLALVLLALDLHAECWPALGAAVRLTTRRRDELPGKKPPASAQSFSDACEALGDIPISHGSGAVGWLLVASLQLNNRKWNARKEDFLFFFFDFTQRAGF